MSYTVFCDELKLRFLSIKRIRSSEAPVYAEKCCTLGLLNKAFDGEPLFLSKNNISCPGAAVGIGFTDGLPDIPGGFGHFISGGRGKGYPPGERVKCDPETGEAMLLSQPQQVLGDFDCIRIKLYEPDDDADTVTALVTPDQLSALVHIFCFRKTCYDSVIAPMVSGCASVFRIPFGELMKEEPRAVIGNIDVFSRPHFAKDTFFFTVTGNDFTTMLADAGSSVLAAPIWKGVKSRI